MTSLLTLLLYSRGNPFTYVLLAVLILAFGLVFWLTKGIAFGYSNSKLSENSKSTVGAIQIITSLVLALALPNNYLINFPFFKSLFEKNELWIPVSMFVLLVIFITIFGLLLSAVFKPIDSNISNPMHTEKPDKTYTPSRYRFTTLLLVATGAFTLWLLSGFKGKFNDRMSRYYENDNKYDRNFLIGFAIIIFLITSLLRIIS
jgi:hypothetical protein